jgi:hypothetical protein
MQQVESYYPAPCDISIRFFCTVGERSTEPDLCRTEPGVVCRRDTRKCECPDTTGNDWRPTAKRFGRPRKTDLLAGGKGHYA